jgi:hypothetical protein
MPRAGARHAEIAGLPFPRSRGGLEFRRVTLPLIGSGIMAGGFLAFLTRPAWLRASARAQCDLPHDVRLSPTRPGFQRVVYMPRQARLVGFFRVVL